MLWTLCSILVLFFSVLALHKRWTLGFFGGIVKPMNQTNDKSPGDLLKESILTIERIGQIASTQRAILDDVTLPIGDREAARLILVDLCGILDGLVVQLEALKLAPYEDPDSLTQLFEVGQQSTDEAFIRAGMMPPRGEGDHGLPPDFVLSFMDLFSTNGLREVSTYDLITLASDVAQYVSDEEAKPLFDRDSWISVPLNASICKACVLTVYVTFPEDGDFDDFVEIDLSETLNSLDFRDVPPEFRSEH